ncbi:MAG: hypothetical protein ACRCRT_02630 [Cetobacterium somerae]
MIYKVSSYDTNNDSTIEIRYMSENKAMRYIKTNKDRENVSFEELDNERTTLTVNNQIVYQYIPMRKGRAIDHMISDLEMTLDYMGLKYKITDPYYNKETNKQGEFYLGIEIYSHHREQEERYHIFTGDIGIDEDNRYIIIDPTTTCYKGAYFQPLLTKCIYEGIDLQRWYLDGQLQKAMENHCGCLNIKKNGRVINNEKQKDLF